MLWKTEPTYTVRVYMAGDIAHARRPTPAGCSPA
jgi:hypothetical protein